MNKTKILGLAALLAGMCLVTYLSLFVGDPREVQAASAGAVDTPTYVMEVGGVAPHVYFDVVGYTTGARADIDLPTGFVPKYVRAECFSTGAYAAPDRVEWFDGMTAGQDLYTAPATGIGTIHNTGGVTVDATNKKVTLGADCVTYDGQPIRGFMQR
jgi:hypothetical protein